MKPDRGLVFTLFGSIAVTAGGWFALQPNESPLPLPRVVVDVPLSAAATAGGVDAVLDGESMNALNRELAGAQRRVTKIGVIAGDGDAAVGATQDDGSAFRAAFKRDLRDATEHFVMAADLLDADAMVRNATFNPREISIPESTVEVLREIVRIHQARIRVVREARAVGQARAVEELARGDGLHRLTDARERLSADDTRRIEKQASKLAKQHGLSIERVRIGLEVDLIAAAIDADASFFHGGEAYFAPRGSVRPQLSEFDKYSEFLAIEMFADVLGVFTHAGALSHEETVQAYDRLMARVGNGAGGD